jgi:hypothetical protein
MNVLTCITTCGRPEGYRRTIAAISTDIAVLQDGGKPYVKEGGKVCKTFVTPQAGGKRMYWQRINTLLDYARTTSAQHIMFLPDDFTYQDGWYEKVMQVYQGAALDMGYCGRDMMWGIRREPITPDLLGPSWVDGAFIAPWSYFACLAWRIPEPPESWFEDPARGSGVWRYVSKQWHRRHLPVYAMRHPVMSGTFDPNQSQMNKDRNHGSVLH